jgi:hypothetical protein
MAAAYVAWLDSQRRSGVTPEELYRRLVDDGRSASVARAHAERLLPERSRHPVAGFLFYFAFGFAALFVAAGLNQAVGLADLPTRCVGYEVDDGYAGPETRWLPAGETPEAWGGYSDAGLCADTLDRDRDEGRRALAGWLSASLVAVPLAAVAGVWLARIDRRDRYARAFPHRYVLNNVLLVAASVVVVVRLIAFLSGLVGQLLGVESGPGVLADAAHAAATMSVAGGVLAFCVVAHRRWLAVWPADGDAGGSRLA